jgi:hypothetical protein
MANDLESSIRELAESRAQKLELAEWLTNGLRARPSEPEVRIVEAPQRDELEIVWMSQLADATPEPTEVVARDAADEGSELAAAALRGSDVRLPSDALPASETPDTLQPHLLSKELDDDDLAVLPSKPSLRVLGNALGKVKLGAPWQALERRPAIKRWLAAAAVLLLLGGLSLVRRGEAPAQIQTELAAVQPESAPPPPPSEPVEIAPVAPSPVVTKAPPRVRKAAPAPSPAPVLDELDGPRGPAVARYADLPNRVLARLAKDQDTVRRSEPEPESEATASDDVEQPTFLLDR